MMIQINLLEEWDSFFLGYTQNCLAIASQFIWVETSQSCNSQRIKIVVMSVNGIMWVVCAFCNGEISCFYSNVGRHWQKRANILVFWVRVVLISHKLSPLFIFFQITCIGYKTFCHLTSFLSIERNSLHVTCDLQRAF